MSKFKDRQQSNSDKKGNKPVAKFRSMNVSASVWSYEDGDKVSYSVTLQKSYKDDKDQWQNTEFLWGSDIPHARKALDMAHDFILQQWDEAQGDGK